MTNTLSVQEAERQLAAATATIDQLKARLLNEGPGIVTAEELGAAALEVEHAKLVIAHAIKTAEDTAAAERLDHLEKMKARYLKEAGDVDVFLDAMRMIADGSAIIMRFCSARQALIATGIREMCQADVPRGDQPDEQHAGLGWSDAAMGLSDRLHIDGRTIGMFSGGVAIGSSITRGIAQARAAGYKKASCAPLDAKVATDPAAVNDPEAWLRARY